MANRISLCLHSATHTKVISKLRPEEKEDKAAKQGMRTQGMGGAARGDILEEKNVCSIPLSRLAWLEDNAIIIVCPNSLKKLL